MCPRTAPRRERCRGERWWCLEGTVVHGRLCERASRCSADTQQRSALGPFSRKPDQRQRPGSFRARVVIVRSVRRRHDRGSWWQRCGRRIPQPTLTRASGRHNNPSGHGRPLCPNQHRLSISSSVGRRPLQGSHNTVFPRCAAASVPRPVTIVNGRSHRARQVGRAKCAPMPTRVANGRPLLGIAGAVLTSLLHPAAAYADELDGRPEPLRDGGSRPLGGRTNRR